MRSSVHGGVTALAKRALGVAAVAGAAGLTLAPGLALAAEEVVATADAGSSLVDGVDVRGERPNKPSSTKYTAPPLDTPQTVTVVSDRTIRDQNLLGLRDILQTVPGITFGAGEGGGGYGDSINLRGYSANSDITTDGLRDSAQYSRTDPFNVQQIEVVNGANSVYAGAGSIGGSINLVSKTPAGRDRTQIGLGLGSDGYQRFTVDSDTSPSETVALRVNLMAHRNDVPGRDVETYERWGIAPSITLGLDTPTRVTLSAYHQEDENTPEYGVPYASNAFLNGPLPGVDPSSYYGYRNIDRQEIDIDSLTLRFVHELNDSLSVTSTNRWQRVAQLTIVNPPQGTWCLASGFNAATGASCAAPGLFAPSGPRGNLRDTENVQLVSQTDFNWRFDTAGWSHTLVAGFSFANETYDLDTGNIQRTGLAAAPAYPAMSIADPDNLYTGPINYFRGSLGSGELANQAIYLFDNIELNDHWRINGGIRLEHNDGEFVSSAYTYPSPPTPTIAPAVVATNAETLLSWRMGVVYKPAENASLYVAYGNAQAPSQATVNGGCSAAGTTNPNCDVEPEEGHVLEIGGKWDVLDGRLSLTAALFENERSKFRVNSGITGVSQTLDGASRVRGVTLGAAGQLSDRWTVIANYTYLDSEILQSISDLALDGGAIDAAKGDPLPNTPEHAFNVWTTYMVTDSLMVGYGATYSGEYAFTRPTGSTRLFHAPDFWLHNAAITWTANDHVSLQVNIKNLADETYYTRIRATSSGFGWATPGEARSAQVTLNYRF